MLRTAVLILLVQSAFGQTPQVPHKMNFAGITLTIWDDARREIQKDVDALTQHAKYFNMKVERAKTYFPIIERIFREERLPEDFKYLVLQESALISDAVSVSDAVGFWQFKDFTAIEMGLRVDKEIDERMNIVSSSRAAAQYLKKNNFYFNNWVYALQAYQMGAGGVMRSVSDYESGTRSMEITSRTYWYVKKFIAHMVAFDQAVKGPGLVKVIEYENHSKKALADIAKEVSVSPEELKEYNKWVRKGTIPDDRKYVVAVPVQGEGREVYASVAKANAQSTRPMDGPKKPEARTSVAHSRIYVHGLPAIKAQAGETSSSIAKRTGVSLSTFLACNDLSIADKIIEGQFYYLKKKKSRSEVAAHQVALADETLWSVSQMYGVQLKRVMKLNPQLPSSGRLSPGTVVALSTTTKSVPAVVQSQLSTFEDKPDGYFDWSVAPAETMTAVAVSQQTSSGRQQEEAIQGEAPPSTQVSGRSDNVQVQAVEVATSEPAALAATPDTHIVGQGETLYGISKKYNLSVMDIANYNQLRLEDGLKPGQVLKLPVATTAPVPEPESAPEFMVHEVKPSETLYSVARKYDVTIKDIMEWNSKTDFNIVPGEKIRIKQK